VEEEARLGQQQPFLYADLVPYSHTRSVDALEQSFPSRLEVREKNEK
jgi:hypothetical protein